MEEKGKEGETEFHEKKKGNWGEKSKGLLRSDYNSLWRQNTAIIIDLGTKKDQTNSNQIGSREWLGEKVMHRFKNVTRSKDMR